MTIRKLIKQVPGLLVSGSLMLASAMAAQKAATFGEALEKAGDDGIIAFCYGPDWNKRSVRMLQSFWADPETAEAAGNAVMVAVPFYQDQEHPKAAEGAEIAHGCPAPPFGVCPTVLMMDRSGKVYAHLVGSDYLGDEEGAKGRDNIRARLAQFRQHRQLTDKTADMLGQEKAKVLGQVMDLLLYTPSGSIYSMKPYTDGTLLQEIELADPADKTGLVRRFRHRSLDFRYKMFETLDGFLSPDFVPDFAMMKEECFKIINDTALRTFDRQSAYMVFIGQARREEIPPNQLKGHIKKMGEIDPNTIFGRLAPALAEKWGNIKHHKSPEERKADRERKKAAAQKQKDKKIRDRKQNSDIEV